MTSRERVRRAIRFEYPDVMPVEIHPSPTGLHEHGEKLVDLFRRYPNDFGDLSDTPVRHPAPEECDSCGRYHAFRVDEWGIEWEHTIYGAWGIPHRRPLDDLSNLPDFKAPPPPLMSGPEFETAKRKADEHTKRFYLWGGAGSIFETLHSLRRFEDVLVDTQENTDEINAITDVIIGHCERLIAHALALDVDGIVFGDDYGTQGSLIMSLPTWRRFFKPRYDRLMAPIRAAGKEIHFHSCGYILPLLSDLAELGVNSIWPQLPLFDLAELAKTCRKLGLAVALHMDRSHLMTFGKPGDIHRAVRDVAAVFRQPDGGAWWYIEIDTGFPWENVVALFEAVYGNR